MLRYNFDSEKSSVVARRKNISLIAIKLHGQGLLAVGGSGMPVTKVEVYYKVFCKQRVTLVMFL